MKILYDHQVFSINKYGGVGKYFCELMKNLPKSHSYELSVLVSNNQHLKDNFSVFKKIYFPLPMANTKWGGFLRTKNFQLNSWYSDRVIEAGKYDLLHPTYYNPYFLKNNKKKYIATVHDLIGFKFQHLYRNKNLIDNHIRIINNASRLITVSHNTKKDLIEILKIDPEKIDVIHHGFTNSTYKKSLNEHGRYILYVAARWGYKNFSTLAKAFSILIKEDSTLKLICVGPKFNLEEISFLKKHKIFGNSIAMGVSENKLNDLYAHALVFVYPSLYEGFGMSILEAFANECPVCLSNTSSLPEVAGEAGIYFDPRDEHSILESIKKVIYDTEFRKNMKIKASIQLQNFSWQKCADETVKTYEKALS